MAVPKHINVLRDYRSIPYQIIIWLVGFCLIFFSTGLSHSASGSGPEKTTVLPENNGIVICLPSGIDSMDPTNYRSRITQIVLKNIFDSLTTRDSKNNVIPQLAESWGLLDDTQWQFTLRKNVRFHNGSLLTAADVKFTLDRVIMEGGLDGRTSPRKNLLEAISEVIIEDDYTVRIKTHYPWPNLPLMLSLQEIVPMEYLQNVGSRGFEEHPVGTGPFRFIKAESGNRIVLERFNDYYGGSPLRPPVQTASLKQVIFKIVPGYLDQMTMIKTGQCDIIFNLHPESIQILAMSPHIRIMSVQATRSYFGEINCVRPPFNDVRIRRAMNYGIDIEEFVRNKLQGDGKALSTVLLPNTLGYNPLLQPYPYDPSIARQLLDAAGYPDDRPVAVYSGREDSIFADSIALYLMKLGLETMMVIAPSSRPQTVGPDAPWDIYVGSWGNSTLDPTGILPVKFKSNAYGNFSGFASPDLNRLMQQAQISMDEQTRIDYYFQIQDIIFNAAPMIFGYAPDEYYAIAKRVKNFRPSSTGMIEMHDVYIE